MVTFDPAFVLGETLRNAPTGSFGGAIEAGEGGGGGANLRHSRTRTYIQLGLLSQVVQECESGQHESGVIE